MQLMCRSSEKMIVQYIFRCLFIIAIISVNTTTSSLIYPSSLICVSNDYINNHESLKDCFNHVEEDDIAFKKVSKINDRTCLFIIKNWQVGFLTVWAVAH